MRPRSATLILLAAVVAAGCGGTRTPSTSTGTPTGAASSPSPSYSPGDTSSTSSKRSTRSRPRPIRPSAARVASTFSSAYARYLDGALPAAALPDATAQARAEAGQLMPARARQGTLKMRSVAAVPGGSTFIAQLADRAHSFDVQLTVGRVRGRQLVTGLVPPDFDSILGPATQPIPQPAGSGSAQQAARAFMAGYLPWLYGKAPVTAIRAAAPAVVASLKAHPPNIPPAMQGLHPRLAALGMQRQGPGWLALANVTDGHETYTLQALLKQANGQWMVTSVGLPQ